MSMCMCANLPSGMGLLSTGKVGWVVTLERAHVAHSEHHFLTSADNIGQAKHAEIMLMVVRVPACASWCTEAKMSLLHGTGTTGQMRLSAHMQTSSRPLISRTRASAHAFQLATSVQMAWAAARVAKST